MSDLIERLRGTKWLNDPFPAGCLWSLAQEAAAEIERLTALLETSRRVYLDTEITVSKQVHRIAEIEAEMKQCYECDEPCHYLFDDGRCHKCTRMTPEEVRGE